MSDDQIINFIRDGFRQLDDRLKEHHALLREHTERDEAAWAKLEQLDREITITKRVGLIVGSCATAVIGWLGYK